MTFRSTKALRTGVLLVLILLTACQGKTINNPPVPSPTVSGGDPALNPTALPTLIPSPQATPTASFDLAKLKGQTIDFWHPWQGDLANQAAGMAEQFSKTNPWGIIVHVKTFYGAGALYDGVQAGISDPKNGLPQVVAATSDQIAAWAADGAVTDLNDFIDTPETGWSAAETAAFVPAFWAQEQSASQRIGVPALRSAAVLFYNQTWAKELGFNHAPTTPDEFKQQACAAAKHNNTLGDRQMNGTGGWLVSNDALTTLSWLAVFGAQPLPSAPGQPYTFTSKEGQQAVNYLRGLLDASCAWVGRKADPYDYFTRRMALFYSGNLQDLPVQTRWMEQAKNNDAWGILAYPAQDGKPVIIASGYDYALLQGKTPAAPETQLAAWLFIRWMADPARAAALAQAYPSLPVSRGVADLLSAQSSRFPWNQILPLTDTARASPADASWRVARRLVEDAAWQIYHLPAEGLKDILPQTLPQLDQAIQDTLKK